MADELDRLTWHAQDYYELLEIPRDASDEEIASAARLQKTAWDPKNFDKAAWRVIAQDRLAQIAEAWDCLRDVHARAGYDLGLGPEQKRSFTPPFPLEIQHNPKVWKRMASWLKKRELGTPFERKIAFTAGDYIERQRMPSVKQLPHMVKAWDIALKNGFDPEMPD